MLQNNIFSIASFTDVKSINKSFRKVKYKKFLPKTYDDGIFTNGNNNAYESQYWQMKDAERDTITRNAVKRYLKHNAK